MSETLIALMPTQLPHLPRELARKLNHPLSERYLSQYIDYNQLKEGLTQTIEQNSRALLDGRLKPEEIPSAIGYVLPIPGLETHVLVFGSYVTHEEMGMDLLPGPLKLRSNAQDPVRFVGERLWLVPIEVLDNANARETIFKSSILLPAGNSHSPLMIMELGRHNGLSREVLVEMEFDSPTIHQWIGRYGLERLYEKEMLLREELTFPEDPDDLQPEPGYESDESVTVQLHFMPSVMNLLSAIIPLVDYDLNWQIKRERQKSDTQGFQHTLCTRVADFLNEFLNLYDVKGLQAVEFEMGEGKEGAKRLSLQGNSLMNPSERLGESILMQLHRAEDIVKGDPCLFSRLAHINSLLVSWPGNSATKKKTMRRFNKPVSFIADHADVVVQRNGYDSIEVSSQFKGKWKGLLMNNRFVLAASDDEFFPKVKTEPDSPIQFTPLPAANPTRLVCKADNPYAPEHIFETTEEAQDFLKNLHEIQGSESDFQLCLAGVIEAEKFLDRLNEHLEPMNKAFQWLNTRIKW